VNASPHNHRSKRIEHLTQQIARKTGDENREKGGWRGVYPIRKICTQFFGIEAQPLVRTASKDAVYAAKLAFPDYSVALSTRGECFEVQVAREKAIHRDRQ
jgi:hypothetical protein